MVGNGKNVEQWVPFNKPLGKKYDIEDWINLELVIYLAYKTEGRMGCIHRGGVRVTGGGGGHIRGEEGENKREPKHLPSCDGCKLIKGGSN